MIQQLRQLPPMMVNHLWTYDFCSAPVRPHGDVSYGQRQVQARMAGGSSPRRYSGRRIEGLTPVSVQRTRASPGNKARIRRGNCASEKQTIAFERMEGAK